MNNRGQVMLLTVMIVSGSILGATAIAGILTVNQIRQTTNIANSLQAVFAADAGLEWELYRLFSDPSYPKPELSNADILTKTITGADSLEFRSIGCAGAKFITDNINSEVCPRPINRSLQLFFELVL